jgi:hypothetical protein
VYPSASIRTLLKIKEAEALLKIAEAETPLKIVEAEALLKIEEAERWRERRNCALVMEPLPHSQAQRLAGG